MITIVTTKKEERALMPPPRYENIRKVLSHGVRLLFADRDTDFSSIAPEDVVLIQTRDRIITDRIVATGVKTTAESMSTVMLTHDKQMSKPLLADAGVPTPKTVFEPSDGHACFVKPLHGEDSNCVDEHSICRTIDEVRRKVMEIEQFLGDGYIIEDFIPGRDCTVGLIMNPETGVPDVFPVLLKYESETGILTHELKFREVDTPVPISDTKLVQYAKDAFKAIGAKRYMRIDFRMTDDGRFFLIDLNLFPCLGATDHLAEVCRVCSGMTYPEFLNRIIATATSQTR